MALDVFHQVLTRLYELAGGNPRQAVSIVDVLKQEKLFGSAEMILSKLQAEGWVADASKRDHVYVTTWGIDEVRRVSVSVSAPAPVPAAVVPAPAAVAPPAAAKPAEPKNALPLREAATKARELATTLEELATGAGGTGAQRKAKAKKALAAASAAVEEAFE
jgi:hypothetical protein